MKRIAVPAAFMSMTGGMPLKASSITSVSSQSDMLPGVSLLPDKALIIKALLLILFDAGRFTVTFNFSGGVNTYFISCKGTETYAQHKTKTDKKTLSGCARANSYAITAKPPDYVIRVNYG